MTIVSVITVCYNSEKTIAQTIESVLKQTYPNIEYILIDGQSTDNTLKIINHYVNTYPSRMRLVSEPDTGIYNAMNKGINMANGELIGIINSDDWYEDTAVEKVIQAYEIDGLAVYHGIQRIYRDDALVGLQCTSISQLNNRMIEHPTCFIPKTLYDKYGFFDESYQYVSDYELMLRLQKHNVKFVIIESVLANFREGGASHSSTAVWENYKLWLRWGLMNRQQYAYRSVMDRLRLLVKKRK